MPPSPAPFPVVPHVVGPTLTRSIPSSGTGPVPRVMLALIGSLAIAVPAAIVSLAPRAVPRPHIVVPPRRVVPAAELPPVEPLKYQDLSPDDARGFNETVPFSTDPNPAARPFLLRGTPEDQARATDCMAAAMLYEAGDDTLGERSVGQVIINRTRHPAFPKTICGVVFQGSERTTGCQFTFTCDGALTRHHWSDDAWRRARETATLALTGTVFKAVGHATHYHTDWVVPYWQSSLDKVARVRTHLFFRWTGWWGTPPAFRRAVSPSEPVIPALAPYSDAHRSGAAFDEAAVAAEQAAAITGPLPPASPGDSNSFLVTLDAAMAPEVFAAFAAATCGERAYCKFMGWSSKARTPTTAPISPQQIATMSFSYLRDRARGYDKALWNCAEFKRADRSQCMKLQVLATAPRPVETFKLESVPGSHVMVPVPVAQKPAADGLTGVRRKMEIGAAPPKASATPAPDDR